MDEYHSDTKCMQQREIMRKDGESTRHDQLTRKRHHKGFAAEGVNVGSDRAQPANELNRIIHGSHYNSL